MRSRSHIHQVVFFVGVIVVVGIVAIVTLLA